MIAIAPTATIASIAGCYECIEPQVSNLFKRETLSGEFLQINAYLVRELQARGLWTETVVNAIKRAEGSIQDIGEIPQEIRDIYRTAWELPMRSLIDMAAARGAYIDQSQSLNLFMESPTIGKLSSMYLLPAFPSGHPDQQDHHWFHRPRRRRRWRVGRPPQPREVRKEGVLGRGGNCLLAREPGVLRGVPVTPRRPGRQSFCLHT